MTLGAATLADVFDPKERGTKVNIGSRPGARQLTCADGRLLYGTPPRTGISAPLWRCSDDSFQLAGTLLVSGNSWSSFLVMLCHFFQGYFPSGT